MTHLPSLLATLALFSCLALFGAAVRVFAVRPAQALTSSVEPASGAVSASQVPSRPSVGRFGSAPRLARILSLLMAFGFLGITNAQLPPLQPPLPPPTPPSPPLPPSQHSLPDQRSLAGMSNPRAAGVTLPQGTMRRSSSRAANRQRSHHQTARRQGGWVALRCPGRPVSSLHQTFELRSGHRIAPHPPSRGACASPRLCRGRGMSRWIVAKLYFDLWRAAPRCRASEQTRMETTSLRRMWTATATSTFCLGTKTVPAECC